MFEGFSPYTHLQGKEMDVWINTEVSPPNQDGVRFTVGHNKEYVKVLVEFDDRLVGCVARVCVDEVHRWHVNATVLSFKRIHPDIPLPTIYRSHTTSSSNPSSSKTASSSSPSLCDCGKSDGPCSQKPKSDAAPAVMPASTSFPNSEKDSGPPSSSTSTTTKPQEGRVSGMALAVLVAILSFAFAYVASLRYLESPP